MTLAEIMERDWALACAAGMTWPQFMRAWGESWRIALTTSSVEEARSEGACVGWAMRKAER
jgi:hypothetical protein